MLFGWKKVSPRMHFFATVAVAVGTLFSAFWILSANSWMQTPQGFTTGADGVLQPVNWLDIIFNPSFPYRFAHMVTAAYLTTAFTVGGIGAWYLWRKRHVAEARIMFGMAMIMAVFVAPVQILLGDMHGLNTLHHQPAKVAAMEGLWETTSGAGLILFGVPDEQAEATLHKIEIPKMSSLILTHEMDGTVKGLKEWKKEDRPPVAIVFYAFRVMVGLGVMMALTGLFAAVLWLRKKLFDSRAFHFWCMAMTPAGFIALLAGWFVTEVGRQPWVAYGVIRTAEASSPLPGAHVALSLLAFIVVYTFVFGAGSYYILRLIAKGPGTKAEGFRAHDMVATPFGNPDSEGA
jgi:cytochrome d ubiquinol oxidase subunit I